MRYKTCPHCGSNNDPGESCNCRDNQSKSVAVVRSDAGRRIIPSSSYNHGPTAIRRLPLGVYHHTRHGA